MALVIAYRSFHNSDPPQLVQLWHQCRLGRGAAEGFTVDAFETLIFSQTYFDPKGLIVAIEGDRVVGYVHAAFGSNKDGSALSRETGTICVIMVHPDFRRHGIGRELLRRAEAYLTESGSTTILAGPAAPCDAFYVGIYGGAEPSGFLESDPDAAPFLAATGYAPAKRNLIFQRDNRNRTDPISIRLVGIRRKFEVRVTDQPDKPTWWWICRFGRLDSLVFQLAPKGAGEPVASAGVFGLDLYIKKWNERAVGIVELHVSDIERRKGYGQALVAEICRRLRDEMITRLEAHVPEDNIAVADLVRSTGFEQVDVGIVYRRQAQ